MYNGIKKINSKLQYPNERWKIVGTDKSHH